MNKCILVGNLTRDPEGSTTGSGISVCKFSVAVNRRFASANGERETDFFNIVTWRDLAENCGKYLVKGSKVALCGQIQNRTYEVDGQKRYVTEIIADEVEFLNRAGDSQSSQGGGGYEKKKPVAELKPVEDDGLPF
ncbi:MAG: single-stranded DNA-binding protein [Clostridiales bacterium]|jgi:single-strand DNA-binding protein|nr:single-stranded DNA-binding protein [Clostridiales bacterium]